MKQSAGGGKVNPGLESLVDMLPTQPTRGRHGPRKVSEFEADKIIFGEDSIGRHTMHFSSVLQGTTITWVRICIIRATEV